MIDAVNIILESADLKQDLFLAEDFEWYLRKGNPTNSKMFSFMVQYELAKVFHCDRDKPVMLVSPNGKYLGLKTSRFDDKSDGSFRFEYSFKKKDFTNSNHILRIVFLNYIFNIGDPKNALVFNRQNKISIKRGYSNELLCERRSNYLSLPLFKMMIQSVKSELFELELNRSIVLCDHLLLEKIKNLINYFEPNSKETKSLLSVFDPTYLEKTRKELMNTFYINRK